MSSPIVILVTGANTGIGLEAVKYLCQSDKQYDILLGGRSLQKAGEAATSVKSAFPQSSSTVEAIQIDISSDESITACVDKIASTRGKLDVLLYAAQHLPTNTHLGAQLDPEVNAGRMSIREAWNASWDTNVTGTHVLTHTAMPLLLKSGDPRLLFLMSGTASLMETEDATSRLNQAPPKGWPKPPHFDFPSYRSSKAGMAMMMRECCRLLRDDGVKVFCLSPGFLASGLGGAGAEKLKQMGAEDVSLGGQFIRDVVEGGRDEQVGVVIRRGALVQPW